MDREHVKGATDKVKGAIKDTAGKVTGDEKMQAEGKVAQHFGRKAAYVEIDVLERASTGLSHYALCRLLVG